MDNHKILILHENFLLIEGMTDYLKKKYKINITICRGIDDFLINLRDKKPNAVFIDETILYGNEKTRAIFEHYYPRDSETRRGFSLIKYLRRKDIFPELSSLYIFFTTATQDDDVMNEINNIIGKNGTHSTARFLNGRF